ncbi:serine protease [Adhaeribacter aerolatus]|uniref:Serine protease n=1 Tax=Adhaeribacter aerolatus TaxID=670289 RepID=A0A512AVA2_9BACT|nr:S8 family serine peptidase [Adhaeribacter aerolatus]GEO03642.1 serine protease [Adhaeribacter aerolatus]
MTAHKGETATIIFFLIYCLGLCLPVAAQSGGQARKHLIYFRDKANSPFSVDNPQQYLSDRAISRRHKQQINITARDLPVNPLYTAGLKSKGAEVLYASRWFNAAVVYCDSSVYTELVKLPFVKNGQTLSRRNTSTVTIRNGSASPKPAPANNRRLKTDRQTYGAAYNQANMLGVLQMHEAGFRGEGMHVAVFDGGFSGVHRVPAFAHLFEESRVKATFDFVDKNEDVFEKDTHGTNVLSTLAAYQPGTYVGNAYKANYYLFITEDSRGEHNIEEVNWLLAAEFADSAGVDVINSSLGYTTFDAPSRSYSYNDLNGSLAIVTRAADYAAATGMLVVNSAGNEGNKPWRYISAPADADSALSVGAVDSLGRRAAFSSVGPTADGRIKPNLVAQGLLAAVVTPGGQVVRANGTSFSGPILCGLAVGFWQANPTLTNMQVIKYLERTASQASIPDFLIGYGIPNFSQAHKLAQEEENKSVIFPNPVQNNQLQIRMSKEFINQRINVTIYNTVAQKVVKEIIATTPVSRNVVVDISSLSPGIYNCVINGNDGPKIFKFLKI